MLNYFERGRPELRWGDKANAAFLDAVRAGKGVVVYHFSTAAFDGWTEYEKLSGGTFSELAPEKDMGTTISVGTTR